MRILDDLVPSVRTLLEAVGEPSDLTVLRSWGNRGDDLIYAGLRALLRNYCYREFDIRNFRDLPGGDTAIVSGGGSWCKPFHAIPALLPEIENRFARVVVFPSSYDVAEPSVRAALSQSKAIFFARERVSFDEIRGLCDARLAHDTAFFFHFGPYRAGYHRGTLNAFRRDAESLGAPIPDDNRDLSDECSTLDEWLWTISRHDKIRTDRAHVAIAASMLGRTVEYRAKSYHKVPAIVEYSLGWARCTPVQTVVDDSKAALDTLLSGQVLDSQTLTEATIESLDGYKEESSRTLAALQTSRETISSMRRSWSWRLTAPLRRAAEMLRIRQ